MRGGCGRATGTGGAMTETGIGLMDSPVAQADASTDSAHADRLFQLAFAPTPPSVPLDPLAA